LPRKTKIEQVRSRTGEQQKSLPNSPAVYFLLSAFFE